MSPGGCAAAHMEIRGQFALVISLCLPDIQAPLPAALVSLTLNKESVILTGDWGSNGLASPKGTFKMEE